MNGLIEQAVKQPITVAVGVILAVLAGLLAASRVPIQMTPTVDSVVVSVTTTWENASAAEIESDVVEEQEERLSELTGLVSMTSVSQAGSGNLRLEFRTGTDIEDALADLGELLSEAGQLPLDELADHLVRHSVATRERLDDVALLLLRAQPDD